VSEPERFTVLYEDGDDGWIVASIPALRGVYSQGRTRTEARAMLADALREMILSNLAPTAAPPLEDGADVDSLALVIGP
jgi:predicted RNase H-like HicB family nuclease